MLQRMKCFSQFFFSIRKNLLCYEIAQSVILLLLLFNQMSVVFVFNLILYRLFFPFYHSNVGTNTAQLSWKNLLGTCLNKY